MKKISKFITNNSKLIVIISILLLIPALIGYVHTKINYDILVYLPKDIETIKGQNILTDDFKTGAFSFVFVDNKKAVDVLKLEEKIKDIKGVNKVFSIYDVTDTTIPVEFIPDELKDKLVKKDSTLMVVTFKESTSDEGTIEAVSKLRKIAKDPSKVSGMTAMVVDTMELSDQEITAYVLIAVVLCFIVLIFASDSYIVPIFLLGNIGIAILYNLGSNIMLGEISYITKAITAVLQLGVTTDFSIFLYHKYEDLKKTNKDKKKAMELAINDTFKSIEEDNLKDYYLKMIRVFLTHIEGKEEIYKSILINNRSSIIMDMIYDTIRRFDENNINDGSINIRRRNCMERILSKTNF